MYVINLEQALKRLACVKKKPWQRNGEIILKNGKRIQRMQKKAKIHDKVSSICGLKNSSKGS